jgi:hypothetical protein
MKLFSVILINNLIECCYLMQRSPIQIAVTLADFTRMSVTDPNVTRQSNSIPTKVLLSASKEVFASIVPRDGRFTMIPYVDSKFLPHGGSNQRRILYEFKEVDLNRVTKGPGLRKYVLLLYVFFYYFCVEIRGYLKTGS